MKDVSHTSSNHQNREGVFYLEIKVALSTEAKWDTLLIKKVAFLKVYTIMIL